MTNPTTSICILALAVACSPTRASTPAASALETDASAPSSLSPDALAVAESEAPPSDAVHAEVESGWHDEFSVETVDPAWELVNPDLAEISVVDGELRIRPLRYSVWFHHEAGPGLVREVEGDFALTTVVRARSTRRPSEPVSSNFQFGGLIVRDPTSDLVDRPENYVFSVVGYRGDYLSAETKSTENDLSMVDGPPWPSGDAELRICRLGSRFDLYIREVGASTWTPAISYVRRDLPARVQAGVIAYTYTDDVDLTARFASATLRPLHSTTSCTDDG